MSAIKNQNNELAEYTFVSRYAKYLKDEKRRETWDECVTRMENMHLTRFASIPEVLPFIRDAMEAVRRKEVLGSQRALQFGGDAVLRRNQRINNCWGAYCDRLRVFQEAFAILLYGGGVGLSIQKHHVEKLPTFAMPDASPDKVIYTIPDTIEGWADALGVLLSSYFEDPVFPQFYRKEVVFDYSQIRPQGAEFSHGIGTAPGPDGLRNALDKIRALLDRCLLSGRVRLRPIDCCDIYCHASDAVLSGGVRRSAGILLFSLNDNEMMNAKTGNWFIENPQRGRTNNSFVAIRSEITLDQFLSIATQTKQYGEPAAFFANNTEEMANPCVEIGFYCYDSEGRSGWQACNLSTINGGKIKTVKDFYKAAERAAVIGTLQAAYTDFEYLGPITESIVRREALIGVSITGIMCNPDILCNPEHQKRAAEIVKETNKKIAAIIGINQAARTTCVKPEGTSTTVLGLGSLSGHSPGKGKKFIRHVQTNKTEGPAKFFKEHNPHSVEESVWSANNTDDVLAFICHSPPDAIMEDDLTAIEYLEMIRSTQLNWVRTGTNPELCTMPGLEHNVSNTVRVLDHEWDGVFTYLYEHRNDFRAVSFIAGTGDRDYEQAPFVRYFDETELVSMYGAGACFASGLIERALHAWNHRLWLACSALMDADYKPVDEDQSDWIKSAKRFAAKHLKGDTKKLTYLLKDVYNYKRVLDIALFARKVDYMKCIEETNQTKGTQEISCAGGSCQL